MKDQPAGGRRFALSNYPLSWPDGWARTGNFARKQGQFKKYGNKVTVFNGIERIFEQLAMMRIGREDVLISTNVPTRLDGMPRSDQREPEDPGVAVYWRNGQNAPMRCMAIDIYSTVADNLAAVAATLEAMRAIERHGGAQVQERSFRGFAALPARTGARHWREVLEIADDAPVIISHATIEASFRTLLRKRHPDAGGSNEAMAELNRARQEALEEVSAWGI